MWVGFRMKSDRKTRKPAQGSWKSLELFFLAMMLTTSVHPESDHSVFFVVSFLAGTNPSVVSSFPAFVFVFGNVSLLEATEKRCGRFQGAPIIRAVSYLCICLRFIQVTRIRQHFSTTWTIGEDLQTTAKTCKQPKEIQ